MVICSFKWGNVFFLCKFCLILVCCCLCSASHLAHLLHSNSRSGAGFPFPFKLLPELYVSYNHSQEGTNCISVAGKNVRRLLLLEPEAASSWLGGSWSGGVDSDLFEVSLAMRTDFDARHCFLRMVCT